MFSHPTSCFFLTTVTFSIYTVDITVLPFLSFTHSSPTFFSVTFSFIFPSFLLRPSLLSIIDYPPSLLSSSQSHTRSHTHSTPTPMASYPTPLRYDFLHAFGERRLSAPTPNTHYNPARDNVSCVHFSPDGSLIAVGDHNGRIVIMHRRSQHLPRSLQSFSSSSSSSSSISSHFRTSFTAPIVFSSNTSSSSSCSSSQNFVHQHTSHRHLSQPSLHTPPLAQSLLPPSRRTHSRRRLRPSRIFSTHHTAQLNHYQPSSLTSALSDPSDHESDHYDHHTPRDTHLDSHRNSPQISSLPSQHPHHHSPQYRNPLTESVHLPNRHSGFKFWTQFQSHYYEFDYAKNLDIDEKVNKICWCRPGGEAHRLISANDRVVKVWRVAEQNVRSLVRLQTRDDHHRFDSPSTFHSNPSLSSPAVHSTPTFPNSPLQRPRSLVRALFRRKSPHYRSISSSPPSSTTLSPIPTSHIRLPRLEERQSIVNAKAKRIHSNPDMYQINSVSLSSDQTTFLASDDLRVRLWDLNTTTNGYYYLNTKPNRMKNLIEVITSAHFHPSQPYTIALTTSRGVVKLSDLRTSPTCKSFVKKYEWPRHKHARRTFISELTASICDLSFSPNGQSFLTRDYMTLRLWDMRKESTPVLTLPVHEHLRPHLSSLHRRDYIFDKFQCRFSRDASSLLTGTYHAAFHSYSALDGSYTSVEASVEAVRGESRHIPGHCPFRTADLNRGILALDTSPTEDLVAAAAGTALYLYTGSPR